MSRLQMPKGFKKEDLTAVAECFTDHLEKPTAYKNLTSAQMIDWIGNAVTVLNDDEDAFNAIMEENSDVLATLVAFKVIADFKCPEGHIFMADFGTKEECEECEPELKHQCERACAKVAEKREAKEKVDIFENPGTTTRIGMLLVDEVITDRESLDKRLKELDIVASPATVNTVLSHVGKAVRYMVRLGKLVAPVVEEVKEILEEKSGK